jgi:signal transduction histidine kinase
MAVKERGRGPWLILVVLALLVGTLGVLQYRWTHELGRAAAERRQAELQRAARRFALALERELARAGVAFFADLGPPPADRQAFLIERLEAWQERENAGLVSGLLLATRAGHGPAVLAETRRGDDAFHEIPWPDELRGLGERLAERESEAGAGFPMRPGAVLEKPLGLVLPLFGASEGRAAGAGRPRPRIDGLVVVQLDEAYLRDRLMPRLAEAHFGPAATRPFVLAILRRADRSVFYASEPDALSGDKRAGDVELALPGRGRGPLSDADDVPPVASPEGPARRAERPPLAPDGPWLLVARHRGGSFEATVAAVERRNLVTGFGVLALLGATALVLVASAQRAQRLARQQLEFVTGVTHELNTPLAAIRSAGQNLGAGIVTDPAQVRRYGDLIEKEGGRLTALVAQVLDFAGIESGKTTYAREPLSLATLVDDVLRDNRLVLEQSGIAVEREIASDLPELRGDAQALRRAIANLVTNAAKFAAAGKWIGVRALARPDGHGVVLRVEDRGPGIPRDERERVFEPFYRGPAAERNAAPGSGLGLSLVRHVVRAHGGSVRVEAGEGGGASLVVELPTPAGAHA